MKAFGALNSYIDSIIEFDTPTPIPAPDEILVRVHAVSINPVDTKIRKLLGNQNLPSPRILGFDAAGTIEAIGEKVTTFSPGDEVFYSGDVTRPGSNSEIHTVQAALVAKKPTNLTFAQAAAIPLVAITAYELLFERMTNGENLTEKTILIINGAGGVGSALIPLAKSAGLTIIATASRPASRDWCLHLGAHHIIDHSLPLAPQTQALGLNEFPLIANLHDTELYWQQTSELLAPLGSLGLIVETQKPIHIGNPLRLKSPRIAWEYMPTRSRFQTPDIHRQGQILNQIAKHCENGTFPLLTTTPTQKLTTQSLQNAHHQIQSTSTIGKICLEL